MMSEFKILTIAELQPLLGANKIKLVDVRTDAEISRGYIQGAEKLPLHMLPSHLSELDKNVATVFYCQIGGRSAQAAAFASRNGFVDVYNLQGGITAWVHAGLPVIT
jgi:rhodanese-related sulfurtransferase